MLFDQKIPRGRLYIKTIWLLRALILLPFSRLKRARVTCLLEDKLCIYFGKKYCCTLSSCRMSVYFLLKAMNLNRGDEVLLTPITVPDIVNAIHVLGLKPVFVDMVSEAHNIDLIDLEKKINNKSKVLLITYLSGFVPDIDKIVTLATKYDLLLIEDITQNYGATYKQRILGTFGVASVGSFSPSKTLSSLGGGFIITNDKELFQWIRRLCENQLIPPSRVYLLLHILFSILVNISTSNSLFSYVLYYILLIKSYAETGRNKPERILSENRLPYKLPGGYNFNPLVLRDEMPRDAFTFFTDIQSHIALKTFDQMEDGNKKRRQLAEVLSSLLNDKTDGFMIFRSAQVECRDVFWHYVIKIPKEKNIDFRRFLLKRGIDTTGYELRLCSHEPVFEDYFDETPGALQIYESAVFLPIHPSFSEKQMARVAGAVNEYINKTLKAHHV